MDLILTDSEWESLSESGSSEEQEEADFMYSGQACTILSSLEESIGKIDDFLSFERGFIHGDFVRSVIDPCGQMGKIIDINMFVDLESVLGRIVNSINSKQLFKIRSISVGDYVVNGTWIGRVDKLVDCISIVFDDGSKCKVTAGDYDKLVPVSPNVIDDSQCPYYPGQRVQIVPSTVSRSTGWFCGTWRENQDQGTVYSVNADFVYVDWISSAHVEQNLCASPPSRLQETKDLTLLSCLPHANWQLGDWCMLSFADCNETTEHIFHASTYDMIKGDWKLEKGFKRGNPGSSLEEIFVITKTRTKVDVLWQDGTCGLGLDSLTLLPVGNANAHEFWPHQFVQEKGTCGNSQSWGVVRGVDAKEQIVKVQWRNKAMDQVNGFDSYQMEETVSAYELVEHPDYSYSFGDIVFKVVCNQYGFQADKGHVILKTGFGTEATLNGKLCNDQKKDPSTCHQSYIGIVIGFKDGDVEVKWASGFATKVAPDEIYRIDKYEDSATTTVLFDENTSAFNQEMLVNEMQSISHNGKDLVNSDGTDESGKKFSWVPLSFFRPQVAVRFFSSIASSILGSLGCRSMSSQGFSICSSYDAKESRIQLEKEVAFETRNHCAGQDLSESHIFETINKKQDVKEIEENIDDLLQRPAEASYQFRLFDMVNDCSDHHFLGKSKVLAVSQVKRSWLKKVQQEWSILEKNLPETIYVRICEERMDLLRAALVGAPGTPYHDGLFFFDIFLPSEYPYEPPLLHYYSGGLRLNPNLYESGKVCLSLLNTWTGADTEMWNPQSSTILQVLLSLQALVLNEKPYFNEAGYDKQLGRAEGETNSVSYNENAFLVTCQSMLYILRKPPKHFEALVKEHFSRRANFFLSACNSYMEGTPVGFALECGGNRHDENFRESSTGFKIMLAKLFPKLVEAFLDLGIEPVP